MNHHVVLIVPPRDGARYFDIQGKKDLLIFMKMLKAGQREATAYDCLITRYNLHVHMAFFAIILFYQVFLCLIFLLQVDLST